MSWLSGITGKAELLLNKLDQSAADALTTPEKQSWPTEPAVSIQRPVQQDPSSSFVSKPVRQNLLAKTSATVQQTTQDVSVTGKAGSGSKQPISQVSAPTSTPPSTKKKGLDTDEALFDFLNSSEPLDGSKKKMTPTSSARHSRQSSTSSIISNKSGKVPENPPSSNSGGSSIVHVDSIHGSGTIVHLNCSRFSFYCK